MEQHHMSSSAHQQQGYSIGIFDQPPPEDTLCPICELVVCNPHQCRNGHLFCLVCINDWLSRKEECPVCCCKLTTGGEGQLSQSLFVRNMIDKLGVRCSLGCTWAGKLEDLQNHIDDCCDEGTMSCPSNGCEVVMKRKDFREHKSVCTYILVPCQYCGDEMKRMAHASHHDVCLTKPIPCSHAECGTVQPRGDMGQHLEVCGWEEVQCPNEGCGARNILRKGLISHVLTCDHAMMSCQNCSADFKRLSLAGHDDVCPSKIIPCPHPRCGSTHLRREISMCEWEEVACPYAEVGCSVQCPGHLPRRDVAVHEAEPATAAAVMKSLARASAGDKREIADLNNKLNEVLEQCRAQDVTLAAYGRILSQPAALAALAELGQCVDKGWLIGDPVELLIRQEGTSALRVPKRKRAEEIMNEAPRINEWSTHHIVWRSRSEQFAHDMFRVCSPKKELKAGVRGRISIERAAETPHSIECFLHLIGYRGTCDYTLTMFPHRGDAAQVPGVPAPAPAVAVTEPKSHHDTEPKSHHDTDKWTRDDGCGVELMTAEEFRSQHFVHDNEVCAMATIHLKR